MPKETSRNMYSNTTYENCRIESDSGCDITSKLYATINNSELEGIDP